MPIFVDGHNLIYVSAAVRKKMIAGDVHAARTALCQLIAGGRKGQQEDVRIFFDGTSRDGASQIAGLPVVYAGAKGSADDCIISAIHTSPQPELITVVSSDRELCSRCIQAGAATMGCKAFLTRTISRITSSNMETEEDPDKPDGNISKFEVDQWMDYFDLDDGS